MRSSGVWWVVGIAGFIAAASALAPRLRAGSRDALDAQGRKIPQRYLPKGRAQRAKRISELSKRRKAYRRLHQGSDKPTEAQQERLFRPFATDEGKRTRESTYVRLARQRGLSGDPDSGARAASRLYGAKINAQVLHTAYRRGLAAWASGGHRPGASGSQWAAARVASLLVGGKTAWSADRDLFNTLPKNAQRAIVLRIPEVLSALEQDGRGQDAAAIRAAMEASWRAFRSPLGRGV